MTLDTTRRGAHLRAAEAVAARVLERTCTLAAVPAPPLDEARRSELVAGWWRDDGLDDVAVDAVGNVWARLREGDHPAIVVCAHLDTVFAPTVHHGAVRDGGVLRGPSVGDDSVAVAALSALDQLLDAANDGRAVWLLATVGEEGVGNLVGVRHALASPPVPLGALVALEGNWLGRVGITGVGSVRLRATWTGPGGHAWERADAPNALHRAARAVVDLDALTEIGRGKVAVNVGSLHGGEAINIRAGHAALEVDLRAETADNLDRLEREARRIFEEGRSEDMEVDVEEFGRRPAGGVPADHPLVTASLAALASVKIEGRCAAGSTDANAAYAAGIPAVTLGITEGAGEHTQEEWIAIRPIAAGLAALASTVDTSRRPEGVLP